MEEGITATGKPDEAKPFVGVVPLDRGLYRWAGRRCFEPGAAFALRKAGTFRWRVVVVIKASPLRPMGISIVVHVLLDHWWAPNVAPAHFRVNIIGQVIAPAAPGNTQLARFSNLLICRAAPSLPGCIVPDETISRGPTNHGGNVTRTRAADDFTTIHARMEELRRECWGHWREDE